MSGFGFELTLDTDGIQIAEIALRNEKPAKAASMGPPWPGGLVTALPEPAPAMDYNAFKRDDVIIHDMYVLSAAAQEAYMLQLDFVSSVTVSLLSRKRL